MKKETLNVEGMSCTHCERAVVNALTDIGAKSVTVSLDEKKVTVEYDENALTLDAIKNEITETGYDVVG